MGNPSIGIYSYELYQSYEVENIIRIGTCGSYQEDIKVLDIVLVENSYSKSTYAKILDGNSEELLSSSGLLNRKIEATANQNAITLHKGNVLCSDVFYSQNTQWEEKEKYHCIVTEMESFALFANANHFHKNAACILTVSNMMSPLNNCKELTADQREKSLNAMIRLGLETLIK